MAVKKVDDFPLLHLCLKYSNLLLALLAFHYCTGKTHYVMHYSLGCKIQSVLVDLDKNKN